MYVRRVIFTLLCVWSFSVLPTYAAWVGSGHVVQIRGTSQTTQGGCGESSDCPLCDAGMSCCASVDSEAPAPCCPGDPTDEDAPACPCSRSHQATGVLYVYIPVKAESPLPSDRPEVVAAPAARGETRSLRIPVPPPRLLV